MEVDTGITSGDYLSAFLQGTRNALYENGRQSITITIEKLDAYSVGALIALYERAVGFYASLVNINAYHQPGVEAGKKMAGAVIKLQVDVLTFLRKNKGASFTVDELARAIHAEENKEMVFKILEHASVNADHKIAKTAAKSIFGSKYTAVES
jgi:glucose-6-phosphate isomerase